MEPQESVQACEWPSLLPKSRSRTAQAQNSLAWVRD